MFTGCYDSENGDVPQPYEPLPAAYYVAGTVTDVETGDPLTSATITVNGNAPTSFVDGNYVADGQVGENTVSVTVAGYNNDEPVVRKVDIEAVEAGQSYTAVVNVALSKTSSELNVDVKIVNIQSSEKVKTMTPAEYPGLDLTGEDEGLQIDRTFEVVYGFVAPELNGVSAELAAWINEYLGETLGIFGEVRYMDAVYRIDLAPWTALTSVMVYYDIDAITYQFTAENGESANVKVEGVTGFNFDKTTTPNHDYSYTHGHGHGHGDNINAGGGILTPEF